MAELSDEAYEEIKKLCAEGDKEAEAGQYHDSIRTYVKALKLVPEPIFDWETTTWILTAIGDAYFLHGDYERAVAALTDVMHCPGAIGNPFIHMRKGQCHFKLDQLDRAADELTRAYAIEGREMFEDEDPMYLAFLKTRITL